MLEWVGHDESSAASPNPDERSYIAFISYRHKPLDKSAAELIQKRIESYVVPGEYQDRVGGKRLGKVFRDEDELPASSSLSNSITYALDRSKYLLVICTPDLPKSKYCEAEIRYFLKTHDRDHILAILVDGEPDEAFSPLLLHTYDEEGNITGDAEPLAANISSPDHKINHKAARKEIVRVYAALLGCPFDALWQRERRNKTKRAIIAMGVCMAIMLAFIGMVLSKNAQIHQSLMSSYANTARAYSLDDNSDEALAYYAKILESDPDDESAKLGALIELQRKQWIVDEGESQRKLDSNEGEASKAERSSVLATSSNGLVALFGDEQIVIADAATKSALSAIAFHVGILNCEFDTTGNRLKVEHYSSSDWGDTGKMVSVYDMQGHHMGSSEKNVRYDIVGSNFSSNGSAILWADTRSLSLLDGFHCRSVTAPTWTQIHLTRAHLQEDGHILAADEEGTTHEYRVVDFSGADDKAAEDAPDQGASASSYVVAVSDSGKAIQLLDESGNVLDSISSSDFDMTSFSEWGNRFGRIYEDKASRKVYFCTRDDTQEHIVCVGVSDDGTSFAEPYELSFDKERQLLTCTAFPGGFAAALTGATIFVYRDGDAQPYRTINPNHGSYIQSLVVNQHGQLAVEMWHDRHDDKLYNYIELWDVDANTQVANLDKYESGRYRSGDLSFDAAGTRLSYTLTTTPDDYCGHDREADIQRKTWVLDAPNPDKAAVAMLQDLNSYELQDDLTLAVKDARFNGEMGNWTSLLSVTYPYEGQ